MSAVTFMAAPDLKQHPLSRAFPPMADEERLALLDSISVHGIFNAITIHDGQILDGNHRYQIAMELSCPCPATQLADRVLPQDFVIAQNKVRRHITQAQMAIAVAEVNAWRPVGNPAFVQLDTECPIGKTIAELAGMAGVHPSTMKQAKIVHKSAVPQVIEALKDGQIGLPKAAAIAKLSPDQQVAAITAPLPKRAHAERMSSQESPTIKRPDTQQLESTQYEVDAVQAADDADPETLDNSLAPDDKLAALQAENSRLRAVLAATELARDGHMRTSNELMSEVKDLRKKLEKLEAADV